MIVRVSTVGQYRLPDADADRLNELDNEVVTALDAGDEAKFKELFGKLIALVQGGEELAADELEESDVIVPPPDISFEEAGTEFSGEGLIPG